MAAKMSACVTFMIVALSVGAAVPSVSGSRRANVFSLPQEEVPFVPKKALLRVGEELVYEARWAGMPGGRVVLAVKWKDKFKGKYDIYHVKLQTQSNSFISIFYPVSTEAESYLDADGSFSRFFKLNQNEGRIRQKEKVEFDYDENVARYEKEKLEPFSPKHTVNVRLTDKVQDPLSCIYYVRLMDLRAGESARMVVHTCRRRWLLGVRVLKKEKITLPALGEFSAIKIQAEMAFPGVFVRKGRMTAWLEEKSKVPLKMTVDIPIGSVTVLLTEARNSSLVLPGKE